MYAGRTWVVHSGVALGMSAASFDRPCVCIIGHDHAVCHPYDGGLGILLRQGEACAHGTIGRRGAGPIEIAEAAPGDVLEVQILKVHL